MYVCMYVYVCVCMCVCVCVYCAKHAYSVSLAVFWITEHEIVCCVASQHGGCMLCLLTTRRLNAVSSYNAEVECCAVLQRGG